MPGIISTPPVTPYEPVTEILHGVPVVDPYRWLEDQSSPRTRAWIDQQTRYARRYLDAIPGRDRIRKRVQELLAVETNDSLMSGGGRYFFRKRLKQQQQPSIYMRETAEGEDRLLLDPAELGRGNHIALKLRRVSDDGRLLLYETKEGGERCGSFAIFDVDARKTRPDLLPKGFLRGFAFIPDDTGFCYVHETVDPQEPCQRAAYLHIFGTDCKSDREIFRVGLRSQAGLAMVADTDRLGFLVYTREPDLQTDFYLMSFDKLGTHVEHAVERTAARFHPVLLKGRIFAKTDLQAPNFRIVELRRGEDGSYEWRCLICETEARIRQWSVLGSRILVAYAAGFARMRLAAFDLDGFEMETFCSAPGQSVHLAGASGYGEEAFVEFESFTHPVEIYRYRPQSGELTLWSKTEVPFDGEGPVHIQTSFAAKDGTTIPVCLLAKSAATLEHKHQPAIMTSYGGFGVPAIPQFSALVTILIEQGCVFALPAIRGGSEFGVAWHDAAKRRKRQSAYEDFLSAARWLIETDQTTSGQLVIFGGSNSGLLVAAAMTQDPELFRAVLCMVPLADMLRYHLFDTAGMWREEFGTSDDPADFAALHGYSPYHRVRDGIAYPATMIVSGDADQNCNPLHARKMTARLQAANTSDQPILLDYSKYRGHSPMLPLDERIAALTDRIAFLSEQLRLS